MSLKHAILGLLTFHPMSGYTLKNEYFDKSIGNFWSADQAQIYRTLQSLESDHMVQSEIVDSSSRPNQRLYTITNKGQEELENWLATPHPPQRERIPFLVQLYFCRLLPKEQLLDLLKQKRKQHQGILDIYNSIKMPEVETEEMKQQLKFGSFTLDFGRRKEIMHLEWLDSTIAEVESWD